MNNDDMSELFNKFNTMMNEGNIPDDIKNVLSSFSDNPNAFKDLFHQTQKKDTSSPNIDFDTILKMKSMIEKMNIGDDPRSNLLKSLKPYLNDSRKNKVDQYIKLFGMSKAMEIFGNLGGEEKK